MNPYFIYRAAAIGNHLRNNEPIPGIQSKAARDLEKGDVVLTGYGKPAYEVLEASQEDGQIKLRVRWSDGGIDDRFLDQPDLQIPVE